MREEEPGSGHVRAGLQCNSLIADTLALCEVPHTRAVSWETRHNERSAGVGSIPNHVNHGVRLRKHRNVTAVELRGLGIHPIGNEALEFGIDRAILGPDDIPTWLRFPGSAGVWQGEDVLRRSHGSGIHQLLVRVREVATEVLGPLLSEPEPSIRDVDTVEYGSAVEFVLLSLRGLAVIWSKSAQVDQRSYTVIHAGVSNQRAPIGVADENNWAPNPSDAPNHALYVAFETVETVPTGHAVISLGLERGNYPAEARSVRPEAVGKDDAGLRIFR
jgi:hypothetical protein